MASFVGKAAILSLFAVIWVVMLGWADEYIGRAIGAMFLFTVFAFLAGVAEASREKREEIEREREREWSLRRPPTENTHQSGTT